MVTEQSSTLLPNQRADAGAATSTPRPVIEVRNLHKTFRRKKGEPVHAVDGVSLAVVPGEMVVLLGPSGCGKTTLLRCIAGLEEPDGGECLVDGELVSGPSVATTPPEGRNIGMMFQSYALWPHMTVRRNVAYPLEVRRRSRAEINQRVAEVLRVVGVEALIDQHPGKLSGGQQQRVALARCLVAEPRVMLFDEPLSNVDAKVRVQLRREIVDMQRRLGFAGIYVTHDQDEAMQLADRIAVMGSGKIVQVGTPREVYREPATTYVAEFIGAVNRWSGRCQATTSGQGGPSAFVVEALGTVLVAPDNVSTEVRPGDDAYVLVRPEGIAMRAEPPRRQENTWAGTVERETYVGAHIDYQVRVDDGPLVRLSTYDLRGATRAEGERVWLSIDPEHLRVLPVSGGSDQP